MSIDLRWGEGSYGISPNLSCDRVVSSNSPIFELITKMEYCFYGAERTSLTEMIDTMIRSIGQLYRDGKASAHDVDEEGNSILHVSYLASYIAFCFTKCHAARKSWTRGFLTTKKECRNSFD